MDTLREVENIANSSVKVPTLRSLANAFDVPEPISLRRLLLAASFEVELVSFTAPKFWDDTSGDPPELNMMMGSDRSVGAEQWAKGCSYTVTSAKNTLLAAETAFQQFEASVPVLIDGIAAEYEQAKNAVVNVIGSALSAIPGVDCGEGSACQHDLKAALEAGLAAVGLPPSLPTTKELISAGAAYFAAEIVDSVVPAIGNVLKQYAGPGADAVDLATPEGKKLAQSALTDLLTKGAGQLIPPPADLGSNDPHQWGSPDPYHLARPAMLFVKIAPRTGVDGSLARGMWTVTPSGIFAASSFHVSFVPPEGVVVPVVLWPTIGQFVRADSLQGAASDAFQSWFGDNFGWMLPAEIPNEPGWTGVPGPVGWGSPIYEIGYAMFTVSTKLTSGDITQPVQNTFPEVYGETNVKVDHNIPIGDPQAPVLGAVRPAPNCH